MSFIPTGKQKQEDKLNPKKDSSQIIAGTVKLPITQTDDFCAELMDGAIDFSGIENEKFLVAVNTDSRNKPPILASTMKGPFEYFEMIEAVGCMWEREQHHAMVYVLTTDFDKSSSFLDEGTIDYIEANYEEIITSGILEAAIADNYDEDQLVPAGLINANPEDD